MSSNDTTTPNKRTKVEEKNDDGATATDPSTTEETTTMDVDLSNEKQITMKSADGVSYNVPISAAKMFGLFKDYFTDDEETDIPILEVPRVDSDVLVKVIEFCKHHQIEAMNSIPQPLKTLAMADYVQQWYADFIDNAEVDMVMKLISAANYIDIQPILDLACAKVASIMRSNVPDDIRRIFNIENDFTPEEMQQIIDENEWIEEP